MPWKDTTIMEEKIEFICEWRTGKHTIAELCRGFGISRPTAYKIIARFEEKGYDGLRELSKKPKAPHPNQTDEKVVNGILKDEFYLDQCFFSTANAKKATKNAIEIYNNKRLHVSLGYNTPQKIFEKAA